MYEDETLAGDGALTDSGLGALLAAVERVGRARLHWVADTDALATSMRRLARACVRASESADPQRLIAAASEGIVSDAEATLVGAQVSMGGDADANARRLASYLDALVSEPATGGCGSHSSPAPDASG
jgi:hypothetical protein